MRVLRFSVGFGKAIWSRRGADDTEYVIAAIPLGGYVKMLDEREGEVPEDELDQAFNRKSGVDPNSDCRRRARCSTWYLPSLLSG